MPLPQASFPRGMPVTQPGPRPLPPITPHPASYAGEFLQQTGQAVDEYQDKRAAAAKQQFLINDMIRKRQMAQRVQMYKEEADRKQFELDKEVQTWKEGRAKEEDRLAAEKAGREEAEEGRKKDKAQRMSDFSSDLLELRKTARAEGRKPDEIELQLIIDKHQMSGDPKAMDILQRAYPHYVPRRASSADIARTYELEDAQRKDKLLQQQEQRIIDEINDVNNTKYTRTQLRQDPITWKTIERQVEDDPGKKADLQALKKELRKKQEEIDENYLLVQRAADKGIITRSPRDDEEAGAAMEELLKRLDAAEARNRELKETLGR